MRIFKALGIFFLVIFSLITFLLVFFTQIDLVRLKPFFQNMTLKAHSLHFDFSHAQLSVLSGPAIEFSSVTLVPTSDFKYKSVKSLSAKKISLTFPYFFFLRPVWNTDITLSEPTIHILATQNSSRPAPSFHVPSSTPESQDKIVLQSPSPSKKAKFALNTLSVKNGTITYFNEANGKSQRLKLDHLTFFWKTQDSPLDKGIVRAQGLLNYQDNKRHVSVNIEEDFTYRDKGKEFDGTLQIKKGFIKFQDTSIQLKDSPLFLSAKGTYTDSKLKLEEFKLDHLENNLKGTLTHESNGNFKTSGHFQFSNFAALLPVFVKDISISQETSFEGNMTASGVFSLSDSQIKEFTHIISARAEKVDSEDMEKLFHRSQPLLAGIGHGKFIWKGQKSSETYSNEFQGELNFPEAKIYSGDIMKKITTKIDTEVKNSKIDIILKEAQHKIVKIKQAGLLDSLNESDKKEIERIEAAIPQLLPIRWDSSLYDARKLTHVNFKWNYKNNGLSFNIHANDELGILSSSSHYSELDEKVNSKIIFTSNKNFSHKLLNYSPVFEILMNPPKEYQFVLHIHGPQDKLNYDFDDSYLKEQLTTNLKLMVVEKLLRNWEGRKNLNKIEEKIKGIDNKYKNKLKGLFKSR